MAFAHGDVSADLLIKNLPRQFTDDDKESLLQHFGAKHVVCMGAKGKMVRSCVYFIQFLHVNVICIIYLLVGVLHVDRSHRILKDSTIILLFILSVMQLMQRLAILLQQNR